MLETNLCSTKSKHTVKMYVVMTAYSRNLGSFSQRVKKRVEETEFEALKYSLADKTPFRPLNPPKSFLKANFCMLAFDIRTIVAHS